MDQGDSGWMVDGKKKTSATYSLEQEDGKDEGGNEEDKVFQEEEEVKKLFEDHKKDKVKETNEQDEVHAKCISN